MGSRPLLGSTPPRLHHREPRQSSRPSLRPRALPPLPPTPRPARSTLRRRGSAGAPRSTRRPSTRRGRSDRRRTARRRVSAAGRSARGSVTPSHLPPRPTRLVSRRVSGTRHSGPPHGVHRPRRCSRWRRQWRLQQRRRCQQQQRRRWERRRRQRTSPPILELAGGVHWGDAPHSGAGCSRRRCSSRRCSEQQQQQQWPSCTRPSPRRRPPGCSSCRNGSGPEGRRRGTTL